jgi:uncharacterized protein
MAVANKAVGNKEIVEKINAAFARGKSDEFLALCADDFAWSMVGEKTVKGKDAVRDWLKTMPSEPPKFTINSVIGEGDSVVAYGDMMMKDKEGKTNPYAFCDIYRFRDSRVVELTSYVIKTSKEKSIV